MSEQPNSEFEKAAAESRAGGIFADFRYFLRQSRKWWLAPVILILLLVGGLMLLGGTAAAPFIYTLF